MRPTAWSIATRLFALQLVIVILGTAVAVAWSWHSARADLEQAAREKSTAVAVSVARNPFVLDQVTASDPSLRLEPYALDVMKSTGTDFITIMATDRTRYTHPDRAEIGQPFVGTIAPALAGKTFTETSVGTLGASVRAVTPVEDPTGHVVALVSAGITVSNISAALAPRLHVVLAVALAIALGGAVFSWLLSRYLGRVTQGRGPEELARVFASYEGVLHSVHEGLIVVDPAGRIVLRNDRASELLGLPVASSGVVRVADLDAPESLRTLLASGGQAVDAVHERGDLVLVVSQEVAVTGRESRGSRPIGTVATIRDRTEFLHLSEELATMRTLSEALRSQTHEFANRLHTIVSLIELGRTAEAVDLASDELELGRGTASELGSAADEPILVALLAGKAAQARERQIGFSVAVAPTLSSTGLAPSDIVTIIGNLVDNAFDAVGGASTGPAPTVSVTAFRDGPDMVFAVTDTGPGIDDVERAFRRGFSTKPHGPSGRGVGLALVRAAVSRLGGSIDVATGPSGTTVTVSLSLSTEGALL